MSSPMTYLKLTCSNLQIDLIKNITGVLYSVKKFEKNK